MGEQVARALPFFHAFTGCDTTSQFGGKGKKTTWKAWKSFPDVSCAFTYPALHPFSPLSDDMFSIIERFTCIVYDNTTDQINVNDLKQQLFASGKHIKMMESLPPTKAALLQHVNRSLYQASIWLTSLQSVQQAPPPDNFGWTKQDGSWVPIWSLLPEAAKSC